MRNHRSKLVLRYEFQSYAVYAVAFAGRWRAVIEDMAQMGVAPGADPFSPHSAQTQVGVLVKVKR